MFDYDKHLTYFWLNTGDFKLLFPGPFMISLKWQYREIWLFSIVPYSPFQKN